MKASVTLKQALNKNVGKNGLDVNYFNGQIGKTREKYPEGIFQDRIRGNYTLKDSASKMGVVPVPGVKSIIQKPWSDLHQTRHQWGGGVTCSKANPFCADI